MFRDCGSSGGSSFGSASQEWSGPRPKARPKSKARSASQARKQRESAWSTGWVDWGDKLASTPAVKVDKEETESAIVLDEKIATIKGVISGIAHVKGDVAEQQRKNFLAQQQELFVAKSRRKPDAERRDILNGLIDKCQASIDTNEEKIEELEEANRASGDRIEEHRLELHAIEVRIAEQERLAANVGPADSISVVAPSFQAVTPADQKRSDMLAQLSTLLSDAQLGELKQMLLPGVAAPGPAVSFGPAGQGDFGASGVLPAVPTTPERASPGGVTTPVGSDPYMNRSPLTADMGAFVPDAAEDGEFQDAADADMDGSVGKSLFQNIVEGQAQEDRRPASKRTEGGGAFRAARAGAADQSGKVKSAISKVRPTGVAA